MDLRVAHGDAVGMLRPIDAVASGTSQVQQDAIGIAEPQIPAAGRVRGVGQVISKNRDDGQERVGYRAVQFARYRRLRDKDNGVRGGDHAPGSQGARPDTRDSQYYTQKSPAHQGVKVG